MTTDLAIFLGLSTHNCGKRIGIATSYTSSVAEVRLQYVTRVLTASAAFQKERAGLWEGQARSNAETPLVERPWFVATTASIITAVVVTLFYLSTKKVAEL